MSKFSIETLNGIAQRAHDDIMTLIDQHGWPALTPANFLERMDYNGAIEYLEQVAQVLRSRALEQRRPAVGGNMAVTDKASVPEGATDKTGGSLADYIYPGVEDGSECVRCHRPKTLANLVHTRLYGLACVCGSQEWTAAGNDTPRS